MDKSFTLTGAHREENWFYKKYYYGGANCRYHTFHIALNILNQRVDNPVIIETGCQRLTEDLGGGMSTSLFAEYIHKYGGSITSCDISKVNLTMASKCVKKIASDVNAEFFVGDSVKFLQQHEELCDLLYLDSFDYPYGELLNKYGGTKDIEKAEEIMWSKPAEEIIAEFEHIILPCQEHCVNEYQAAKHLLKPTTVLLIDDNLLPGGGKPRLLRDILFDEGWICLLDFQQSLWVKEI